MMTIIPIPISMGSGGTPIPMTPFQMVCLITAVVFLAVGLLIVLFSLLNLDFSTKWERALERTPIVCVILSIDYFRSILQL